HSASPRHRAHEELPARARHAGLGLGPSRAPHAAVGWRTGRHAGSANRARRAGEITLRRADRAGALSARPRLHLHAALFRPFRSRPDRFAGGRRRQANRRSGGFAPARQCPILPRRGAGAGGSEGRVPRRALRRRRGRSRRPARRARPRTTARSEAMIDLELTRETAGLVLVDWQERLLKAMPPEIAERALSNAVILVEAAKR